jgi:hypothetical protein
MNEKEFMKRRNIILLGVFGTVLGVLMILPALGQHHQRPEAWTSTEMKGLLSGLVLVIGGASTAFYGVKKGKPRTS